MENQDTQKKQYKKHKEGFKIAIDYKANTSLKSYSDTGMYPLYIEVRTKGQKSYFKSYYNFFVSPTDLQLFLNNPFVAGLLAKEANLIREHLENHIRNSLDKISLTNWIKDYRTISSSMELGHIPLLFDYLSSFLYPSKELTFKTSMNWLTRGELSADTALAVANVLKGYGVTDIDRHIEVFEAFRRAATFLEVHATDWFKQDFNAALCFDQYFIFDKMFYFNINNKSILSFPKDEVDIFCADIDLLQNRLILKNIH
jgi:hypothetical protein